MIEVVHFRNRFGKYIVGVLEYDKNVCVNTPSGKEYAQRYAAGLEKPYYPVPVVYDSTIEESSSLRLWAVIIRLLVVGILHV